MAKRPSKRYYSDDDIERGVTPSQLRRMGKARQLEYITHWFFRNFEDPANQTPYNGREGGYLYIWGGPYDARDEIGDEFGELVSEEVIDQAVDLVERDGISDWAPGPEHPDHQRAADDYEGDLDSQRSTPPELDDALRALEAGARTTYGDPQETILRQRLADALNELATAIRPRPTGHGRIGHNQPPEPIDDAAAKTVDEVRPVVEAMQVELAKSEPDALAVGKGGQRLRKLAAAIAKDIRVASEAAAKAFGDTVGKGLGGLVVAGVGVGAMSLWPKLAELASHAASAAASWLGHVVQFF